ncbi:peptidoglycan-binding protein [Promicromonospora sp. NPDC059942]|uniref:peptidoglycan-binding protein n=1 Tax=Promicromonospora sp. NPDC059942 TaxID=3347009 RepID=UPI003662B53F
MKFVSRAEWGARQGDVDAAEPGFGWKGVVVHHVGQDAPSIGHSGCAAYMRSIQNEHINSGAYGDIAYNLAVCLHGYVFEGRGLGKVSGANGTETPGANYDYFAVLGFLGLEGASQPTAAMIEGFKDAIAYCRRSGNAGLRILGHRDVRSTQCPGNLYPLVENGSLEPGPGAATPTYTVQQGDTLATIARLFGITAAALLDANWDVLSDLGIAVPDTILPAGTVLTIPGVQWVEPSDPGTSTGTPAGCVPFPGTEWFKAEPNSAIITAMGRRLVAEGAGRYKVGPGPQWSDIDRQSYAAWQTELGYRGADADGWPGRASWNQLRVPDSGVSAGPVAYEPFPGAEWFRNNPNSPIVTAMGVRLVAEGCGAYLSGPGPQWSNVDQQSYANWQKKLGYSGADADGWPGQSSWDRLRVPKQSTTQYEPFPGVDWFKNSPNSGVVTAMGNRLVAEGCSVYAVGPGPQWSDVDRQSYALWQRNLGFSGADADGWPGPSSWEALRVPKQTAGAKEPFPGAAWFHASPRSTIVAAMGHRLVAEGCAVYETGPGPQWTEADRQSYANWQKKLGYTGSNADGWPGQTTWDKLGVPLT